MIVDHVYLGREFEHKDRYVVPIKIGSVRRHEGRPEICRVSKIGARLISWIDEHGQTHTTPKAKFDAIVGRWLL